MNFKKVTAIIRPDQLEAVESRLKEMNVPGVSVSKVKGYGEAIMDSGHTGTEGDGLVCISPIENIYHIRTKTKCIKDVCA